MSVLVGYVPGPQGEAVLEAAMTEAESHGLPIIVLNTSRGEAYVDNHLASAEEIDAIKARLSERGLIHEFHQFSRGKDAADEVLEMIDERRPALVVIGIRRRSPVGKLFLGSTAQRILLGAHCPVLAVKA